MKQILLVITSLFLFASCDLTKEYYTEGDEITMKKVYLRFEATSTERFATITSNPFKIIAGIGGSALIKEDVTVDIAIDRDFLKVYNEKTTSTYEALPEKYISAAPLKAIIKAGEQGTAITFMLSVNTPEDKAEIKKYVLPIRITNVTPGYSINDDKDDDPSLNMSYLIVQFNL